MNWVLTVSVAFFISVSGFSGVFAASPSPQEKLVNVCAQSKFDDSVRAQLEDLFKQGADLNQPYSESSSSSVFGSITRSTMCMNVTIDVGNAGLLEFIISKGAKVRAASSAEQAPGIPPLPGKTAFDELGEYYMRAGGWDNDPKVRNSVAQMTELLVSAYMKEAKQAGILLDASVTDNGANPLGVAALYGADASIEALLDAGADVNAVDRDHHPALIQAIVYDHPSTSAILTARGANIQCAPESTCPLYLAAQIGDVAIARDLLNHKADIKYGVDSGDNVLYHAGMSSHPSMEMIRTLVEARADVNAPYLDRVQGGLNDGKLLGVFTPVISVIMGRAEANDKIAAVQYLLDQHANPNAGCAYEMTPLGLAKNYKYDGVAKALLAAGADPSQLACQVARDK